jgi:hypothetical protein
VPTGQGRTAATHPRIVQREAAARRAFYSGMAARRVPRFNFGMAYSGMAAAAARRVPRFYSREAYSEMAS